MKKTLILLSIASVFLVLFNSCANFGTKIDLEGGELYYKGDVTEDEAMKLGAWLEKNYFTTNTDASVQLQKDGDTYQARFVIKDEIDVESEEIIGYAKMLQKEISFVFDGAPVEIHMCDNKLDSRKEILWESEEETTE